MYDKTCNNCKYYRGGTVCDILMRIDKAKTICLYYEKIKGGAVCMMNNKEAISLLEYYKGKINIDEAIDLAIEALKEKDKGVTHEILHTYKRTQKG